MTAKTAAALNTQADTDLPDNTTGDISPADVRGIIKDIIDSYLNTTDTPFADTAAIRAKTASRLLSVPLIYGAHAPVTLTDAATITVDLNTGTVFTVTLGGNRTLGNPTNATVGQSGILRVAQDGTGSRTLALSSDWEVAGGSAPDLSTTAGAVDLFSYYVYAANTVYLFPIGKDFS